MGYDIILAIPIQTFFPQDQPFNQICVAYEVEHVTLVQLEITSPSETQPSSQPSPLTSPHKERSHIQSQPLDQVVS